MRIAAALALLGSVALGDPGDHAADDRAGREGGQGEGCQARQPAGRRGRA